MGGIFIAPNIFQICIITQKNSLLDFASAVQLGKFIVFFPESVTLTARANTNIVGD